MKRRLFEACAGLILALLSAPVLSIVAAVDCSTFYCEPVGANNDAGSSFATAKVVTGGPWLGIAGALPPGDTADYFFFGFSGGDLHIKVNCTDGTCGSTASSLYASLFYANQTAVAGMQDIAYGNESHKILDAGNYYLEVSDTIDPPFTINMFTGPSAGNPGAPAITAPMPEPASLALLGLGLAGLGLSRRRRA